MLKDNWILMMLAVLCLVVVADAQPVNLFPSGDMEDGGNATTPPNNWSSQGTGPGQGTIGVSSDTPTGSGQSLMVTGWDDPDYDYWTYSNAYSTGGDYGGKDYNVSFDFKGDAYLVIYDVGGAASNKIYADWFRVEEWTHVEFSLTAGTGTTNFLFYLYDNSGAGNSAWLDNVEVCFAVLEGDANRDGVVSAGDFASVQANVGNTGAPNDPNLFGDANLDGMVSAGDYASIQSNFGSVAAVGAIPEPCSLSLLSLGGFVLAKRRRR